MHLIIVGNGNMARVFAETLPFHGVTFSQGIPSTGRLEKVQSKEIVAVHVGSGRELPNLLRFCEEFDIPLIQASSKKFEGLGDNNVTIVDTPNLALPVAALFDVLPRFAKLMRELGAETFVGESHQSTKTSPPITAQKIAVMFGNKPESVESIRDPEHQRQVLQVPEEYLGGHAYHHIRITACGMDVGVTTRIHGRDVYVAGAIAVAWRLVENLDSLPGAIISADELMFSGKYPARKRGSSLVSA